MKGFGYFLIVAGVIYLLFAFNMDVSLDTPSTYIPGIGSVGGGNIANLDLMERRQNHLIVAALITIIGVILAVFGKDDFVNFDSEPSASSPASTAPAIFEGERALTSDGYRLWLAKTYDITRNDVFDRFVMGEQTFADLDAALVRAHELELARVAAEQAAEEQRLEIIEANKAAARAYSEQAEAEWQAAKPKLIAGVIVVVGLIVIAYFALRESPEEKAARLAREEAARVELVKTTQDRFGIILPKDVTGIAVAENNSGNAYLCNDSDDGILLTFETKLSQEEVKDLLVKALGQGTATYEVLPDKFDWEWQKAGKHYELSMFSEGSPTDVNLCMIE